ncbi:hypothetical protein SAMN05444158_3120 [Bradyrhizobium canariense]|uniref:Uncharacterized protein n=1 Tax=Bradyrhizobium canariense TaxID=255045 RepID=A0A1H1UX75_9BRAD|nr:hypothetical protein SAMN05444158_3120 [Bradyrhizobium canariense]
MSRNELSEPEKREIPCKIPCYQGICPETGAISTASPAKHPPRLKLLTKPAWLGSCRTAPRHTAAAQGLSDHGYPHLSSWCRLLLAPPRFPQACHLPRPAACFAELENDEPPSGAPLAAQLDSGQRTGPDEGPYPSSTGRGSCRQADPMNALVAQGKYFRGMKLALAEIGRRYGGVRVEDADFKC